jgi:tetratricopeptide (TPR) repeat protein
MRLVGSVGSTRQFAFDLASTLAEEGLTGFREAGDAWGEALTLHLLGRVALACGDAGRAQSLCEPSLKLFRAQGDRFGIAAVQCTLGRLALQRGDYAEALALFERR